MRNSPHGVVLVVLTFLSFTTGCESFTWEDFGEATLKAAQPGSPVSEHSKNMTELGQIGNTDSSSSENSSSSYTPPSRQSPNTAVTTPLYDIEVNLGKGWEIHRGLPKEKAEEYVNWGKSIAGDAAGKARNKIVRGPY